MRVGVIGSGLLGTTAALLLDRRGFTVDLIDARSGICQGASSTGEGKIHLGYVYALAEAETVAPIVAGALEFDRVLEEALGSAVPWPELTSRGFTYVVHRESLADPVELAKHYADVHRLLDEHAENRTYLGTPAGRLGVPREVRLGDAGLAAFATDERSVDVPRLTALLERALKASRVAVRAEHEVIQVRQCDGAWWLSARVHRDHVALGPYDVVVNATWDQQDRLDRKALPDLEAESSNFRLRAFVEGRSREVMPAITVVQGPFGDLVGFRDGRFYASWYPVGLMGFATGQHPPDEWRQLEEVVTGDRSLAERMLTELADLVPMPASVVASRVRARVVVAHGTTDIDQRDSRLHHRVGPTVAEKDRWVTPRSPKLTNAPQVARWTCDVIEGLAR